MESRSQILKKISNGLEVGEEFANYMSLVTESPEFDILSYEIQSASNFIERMAGKSEAEYLEKAPEIVRLLRLCAEETRNNGYEFLGEDFERLANDAIRLEGDQSDGPR